MSTRNNPGRRVNNYGSGAERPPCSDCGHNRNALRHARWVINNWQQWYESEGHILEGARPDTVSYNHKIHNSKITVSRLEARLMSQEREFTEELKRSSDIISERDSEISSLKQSLKMMTEKVDNINSFSKEECNSITTKWDAEKEKLSAAFEQKEQMLQAKLQEISYLKQSLKITREEVDNIQSFSKEECNSITTKWEAEKEKLSAAFEQKEQMLQAKLQIQDEGLEKVKQLEEQLKQRDADMLALRKEKEDLSERLMETSNQLSSKQTELLQSEKTWHIKCDALEEKYTKELAEQQDSWVAKVTKMEERVIELEGLLSSHPQPPSYSLDPTLPPFLPSPASLLSPHPNPPSFPPSTFPPCTPPPLHFSHPLYFPHLPFLHLPHPQPPSFPPSNFPPFTSPPPSLLSSHPLSFPPVYLS